MSRGLLGRVLRILDCLTEDNPSLSVQEIIERTGIARSSAHRIIAELVDHDLLVRLPNHRYSIGVRMWEWGELSPLSLRIREAALPHLMRLYEVTGENVHLAVLNGKTPQQAHALFVGRVTGFMSIPTVSRAGGRDPLHATGVGKALLAGRNETWLEEYFSTPLLAETQHTITDEETLRKELVEIRHRGYATTREEMTLGNISVAVPLPRISGLPPIAVGLVVRIDRADEQRLSTFLKNTAVRMAKAVRDAEPHTGS